MIVFVCENHTVCVLVRVHLSEIVIFVLCWRHHEDDDDDDEIQLFRRIGGGLNEPPQSPK